MYARRTSSETLDKVFNDQLNTLRNIKRNSTDILKRLSYFELGIFYDDMTTGSAKGFSYAPSSTHPVILTYACCRQFKDIAFSEVSEN